MLSTRLWLSLLFVVGINLGGCSMMGIGPSADGEDFEVPDSVNEDLGIGSKGEQPSEQKIAPDEIVSDGDKTVKDEDSAQVLQRLKQQRQQTALKPRNAAHSQEAEAAKPKFEAALVELKKGNLESAYTQFQQLSQQYPTLAGPIVNQAIILRKQNKLDEAYKMLQNALLTHAKNPYLLNQLGVVSRELGKFKQAQVSYETAIRIDEYYPNAHYNLAVLADLYLHDPNLALAQFQIYQTLIPEPDKKVAGWIKELERRAK